MEEVKLYVVYDRVARECGPVFQAKNDQVAVRSYQNLIKDVVNPAEYQLKKVGWIDIETGVVYTDRVHDFDGTEIYNEAGDVK